MTWSPEQEVAEQGRAELWRAQALRRAEFQRRLWFGTLAGSPAARADLAARWDAVVQWNAERDLPTTDPDDDPEFDPMGIRENVNVGT